jgi:hypothetical protein
VQSAHEIGLKKRQQDIAAPKNDRAELQKYQEQCAKTDWGCRSQWSGGIHHGLTMSLYYRDPDDNGVELSIDNVEQSEWHNWMRNNLDDNPIGWPLEPDDLARKYHAGVSEAELRRFDPSGQIAPELLRNMIE